MFRIEAARRIETLRLGERSELLVGLAVVGDHALGELAHIRVL